jgi:hypothetical protein
MIVALASEPAHGDISPEISVGGVLVSREQLTEAIDILDQHPESTSIRQLLKPSQNPLAYAPYTRIVNVYLIDHPEAKIAKGSRQHHAPQQRRAFMRYLEERLRIADQSPEEAFSAAEDEVDQEERESPPYDDIDARDHVLRQIAERRGQTEFRSELMQAYSCRCAVTHCDAGPALEAAHLRPWRGMHSNTFDNGLLLRADIHTLLDRGLLAFHLRARTVVLSDKLRKTQYEYLHGRPLVEPALKSQRPSQDVLLWVKEQFQKNQSVS